MKTIRLINFALFIVLVLIVYSLVFGEASLLKLEQQKLINARIEAEVQETEERLNYKVHYLQSLSKEIDQVRATNTNQRLELPLIDSWVRKELGMIGANETFVILK